MRQLLFRKTYFNALLKLEPTQRLEAYDAIMLYAFEGKRLDVSAIVSPVLSIIIDNIAHDFQRYEAASTIRSSQGGL